MVVGAYGVDDVEPIMMLLDVWSSPMNVGHHRRVWQVDVLEPCIIRSKRLPLPKLHYGVVSACRGDQACIVGKFGEFGGFRKTAMPDLRSCAAGDMVERQ